MTHDATTKAYLDAVAGIGCVLCLELGLGRTPATIHHIREDQGISSRASNFLVIPLCHEHHQGKTGFHGMGRRAFERAYRFSELDLLAITNRLLFERTRRP